MLLVTTQASNVRLAVLRALADDLHAPVVRVMGQLDVPVRAELVSKFIQGSLRFASQPMWFHDALERFGAPGRVVVDRAIVRKAVVRRIHC